MGEKRRVMRRVIQPGYADDFIVNNKRQKVRVLDVGPGGMRVLLPEYAGPGSEVFCKIDIYPDITPFYVKGKILRIQVTRDKWEAAVKFDMVRIYNFFEVKNIAGQRQRA